MENNGHISFPVKCLPKHCFDSCGQRLSRQRLHPKPAKKAGRLSTSLRIVCTFCSEPVTDLDLKSRNGLDKSINTVSKSVLKFTEMQPNQI